MYFNRFPKIEYDFPQLIGVSVQDIFRRIQFTENTLNDKTNFEEYLVVEGESPDDIANKVYGSPSYWWLVLLCNNIIDIENEWPKSMSELDRLFSAFLSGNSYYLFEGLDARHGDVIVKRDIVSVENGGGGTAGIDIDKYGVVDSYDPLLRKLDVKIGSGTLNAGDEVHIFRKGVEGNYVSIGGFGETGCYQPYFGSTSCVGISGPESNDTFTHWGELCATSGSTFGIIQRKDSIKDSIVNFKYNGDDVNPYSAYLSNIAGQDDGPSGDFFSYQSLCGMTGTILYDYITDNLNPKIEILTTYADIMNTNDRNRNIKLIVPRMANIIVDELESLLSGSVPRGTTRLIELN